MIYMVNYNLLLNIMNIEFEDLLVSQEAMIKKMWDITSKGKKKSHYVSESLSNNKPSTKHGYKNGDKVISHQETA